MRKRLSGSVACLVAASLVATLALALFAPARALAQRRAIDTYAITGARIVTVSGANIERGTIVVRDGLIVAVGANVSAPPDARIIDGAGLTVYPGLIDASTTLGIPRPTATPTTPSQNPLAFLFTPPPAPSATSPNSSQLPGLQPEILAADIIRPGGNEIEAARSAGITAAQTAPRGNIFLGQSAVINLAGDTPQQMVLRSPVALYVGFAPLGGGQYPGSLMGVFASIRQMLLDAQRYRESNEIYARSPRGLRRPEQDKSLAALLPVLARQMPVVMQADREREITRALDLAQEFNIQVVIAGGQESDKVAERLRASNVPVLLSLNFPRRTTAVSPEADPDPVRLLRERVEAPKTAGRLAAAGVRFAFQSGGMTTMNDFLSNAAKAIENGLARDEAVRALTIRPAEILGVADRLGSIEVGKIANLTVTRGDLFAKERRIAHVFIDGRPVELKPEAAASASAATATGTWTLNVNTGGTGEPEATATLNLQQQGDRLTGTMQGALGSGQTLTGSVTGTEIRFTVPVTLPGSGSQTTDAIFQGTITGNEMRGTVQIVGRSPGTFTGTRAATAPTSTGTSPAPSGTTTTPPASTAAATNLSGTWSISFPLGQETVPATLVLQQQGARLTGRIESRNDSGDITDGSVNGNTFRFSTTLETGGQSISFTFDGTATGNRMSGTITTPRGPVPFSGSRNP